METLRRTRAILRVLAFLALNLVLVPAYLLCRPLDRKARHVIARAYCRAICMILGVSIETSGMPFRDCPTLFVANHVSYLDVVILGAVLDAAFIAKLEISRWPLFGQLGRLSGALFIRRYWRDAPLQRDALAARMGGGELFVLFGEGTSTNGLAVAPFKTSLLSVAEPGVLDRPIAAQAVTLAFLRLADGSPIDSDNCDLYSWYGDADFLPHLWNVMLADGLAAKVEIAPPILSSEATCRKQLGVELQSRVAETLANLRARAAKSPERLPQGVPQTI